MSRAAAASSFRAGGKLDISLSPRSTADATCENRYYFPADCSKSWRLRFYVPQGSTPRTYPIGSNSGWFAWLDGQAPGGGANCKNTGQEFTGTLILTALDESHVAGTICGSDLVNGSFSTLPMCGTCLGVGQTCNSDSECCQQLCDPNSHHCQP